jgi:hypothetical protein
MTVKTKVVVHIVKAWPEFFEAVLDDRKKFEIRKNDRGYAVGHFLMIREFIPSPGGGGNYTGREVEKLITYITSHEQRRGYIVMGIE